MNPTMRNESDILRLPANCHTVGAEELQVRFVLAADTMQRIEIDASEVESIGQAVLQVLLAARAETAANNKDFVIINPSRAFIERITGCRLADALGLALEGRNIH
jgi:anti-anti-sigma regulatory factor